MRACRRKWGNDNQPRGKGILLEVLPRCYNNSNKVHYSGFRDRIQHGNTVECKCINISGVSPRPNTMRLAGSAGIQQIFRQTLEFG